MTALEAAKRRRVGRHRWLAFVLNLFWPPAGYVYAGRPLWAVIFVAFGIVAGGVVLLLTILFPPGVYGEPFVIGRSFVPLLIVSYCITLIAAIHAIRLIQEPEQIRMRGFFRWSAIILSGLALPVIGGLVRAFAPFATYSIPSVSMEPNISVGDVVLTRGGRNNCGHVSIKPGDVVVYRRAGVFNVARAIANAGQTLAVRENITFLDGAMIDRSDKTSVSHRDDSIDPNEAQAIINERLGGSRLYRVLSPAGAYEFSDISPTPVPPNQWFLMKDNRGNGLDSRTFGPVDSRQICGVVSKVLYSKQAERIGARP
jgi:signal peptidase I